VQQFLRLVLETDDIYEGGVARIDKIEIEAPPRTRRSTTEAAFLQQHGVRVRIVGHPRSVAVILEQIARQRTDGQALILTEAELRSMDVPEGARARPGQRPDAGDQEKVEARLRIASLDIDPAGRVENKGTIR
jgi:hypothetical protein